MPTRKALCPRGIQRALPGAQAPHFERITTARAAALPRHWPAMFSILAVLMLLLSALCTAQAADAPHVAAGTLHTCALEANGQVQCWGYNGYDQLGDGSNINPTPRSRSRDCRMPWPLPGGLPHLCA